MKLVPITLKLVLWTGTIKKGVLRAKPYPSKTLTCETANSLERRELNLRNGWGVGCL